MKDIEEYIIDNSKLFSEEPKEGHFERFEQKMQQKKLDKRRRLMRSTLRVASVAVLLTMSCLYVHNQFFSEEESMAYVNQEFMEAQFYYTSQINEGINSIQSIDGGLNKMQRKQLLKEVSEVDDYFEELQEDLKAMPDDPRVIEAMLDYYIIKAKVINDVIESLEKVNTIKQEYSVTVEM